MLMFERWPMVEKPASAGAVFLQSALRPWPMGPYPKTAQHLVTERITNFSRELQV